MNKLLMILLLVYFSLLWTSQHAIAEYSRKEINIGLEPYYKNSFGMGLGVNVDYDALHTDFSSTELTSFFRYSFSNPYRDFSIKYAHKEKWDLSMQLVRRPQFIQSMEKFVAREFGVVVGYEMMLGIAKWNAELRVQQILIEDTSGDIVVNSLIGEENDYSQGVFSNQITVDLKDLGWRGRILSLKDNEVVLKMDYANDTVLSPRSYTLFEYYLNLRLENQNEQDIFLDNRVGGVSSDGSVPVEKLPALGDEEILSGYRPYRLRGKGVFSNRTKLGYNLKFGEIAAVYEIGKMVDPIGGGSDDWISSFGVGLYKGKYGISFHRADGQSHWYGNAYIKTIGGPSD